MRAKARLGGLAREIEEHQEEEVEDEDGARVQDHLDRRQKFRAREQENACHVQEQREHPEHAVDRISASDGQNRAGDAGGR